MSLDEQAGFFWEPFKYERQRVAKSDPRPRTPPPIPETGWRPRAHFPDLSGAKAIGFDTETCDPDLPEKGPGVRRGAYIVGVSVATNDGFKGYYPIKHSVGENLEPGPVFAWLREQLGRSAQPKVGANALYDLDFLSAAGVEVKGPIYDVLYADPLIYEYETSYSLDAVAERRLGLHKETSLLYQWAADAFGGQPNGEQRANIWRCPSSLVGPYAEADAVLPLQIISKQVPLLRAMGVAQVFEMECQLIPLLLKMRQQGVRLDLKRCAQVDDVLTVRIDSMQKEVGIDVYAAEQIKMFCDREGIQYPLTATGKPSFVKKWLESHHHPRMKQISELRKLYKMRDAFVRNALLGSHVNGWVHCEFNPMRSDEYGTVSGRFSSSHPNLQQIPKRDKVWGPIIRGCFIPRDGEAWLKKDLSQIEFRLGVHFGLGEGIEGVRERYRNDPKTDFYNLVVQITGLERDPTAKSIALGKLYGMGTAKYAAMQGIPMELAREQMRQFDGELPFMKETYDYYGEEARQWGFVQTIGGRVCHLDEGYEHKALNRKLQGSCADWIKRSMLEGYKRGLFDAISLHLTVHDELDCGVAPKPEAVEATRELHHIMCNAYPLSIPVRAGSEFGQNWGKLTDYEAEAVNLEVVKQHAFQP